MIFASIYLYVSIVARCTSVCFKITVLNNLGEMFYNYFSLSYSSDYSIYQRLVQQNQDDMFNENIFVTRIHSRNMRVRVQKNVEQQIYNRQSLQSVLFPFSLKSCQNKSVSISNVLTIIVLQINKILL
jgi:hypothetical protein